MTIPSSVVSFGTSAFNFCVNLTGVFFNGKPPSNNGFLFSGNTKATVYYLPGDTGWGPTYGGRPTKLWNPHAQTSDANFGVRTNQFGFNIFGTANIPIVVEASTNLANSNWFPLQNCTLTNGLIYFSDPQWTNYPGRFYRLRSP